MAGCTRPRVSPGRPRAWPGCSESQTLSSSSTFCISSNCERRMTQSGPSYGLGSSVPISVAPVRAGCRCVRTRPRRRSGGHSGSRRDRRRSQDSKPTDAGDCAECWDDARLPLHSQELVRLDTTCDLGGRCRIRTCVGVSRRIYSPLPLAARATCHCATSRVQRGRACDETAKSAPASRSAFCRDLLALCLRNVDFGAVG